jgi:hypothetical protein
MSVLGPILAAFLCFANDECAAVPPPPPPPKPLHAALASWYDDSGTTASGLHFAYGYASLLFGSAWGRRVEFDYGGRRVVGQLDDHGPYVGGRSFDLSPRLRAALGCPDLCSLQWRLAR